MKAIKIHKHGGPEVMQYENITLNAPGPGEVRLRHTAVGLNFVDTYHRSGAYPLPLPLPSGLGLEAAGVVEAVGVGVTNVKEVDTILWHAVAGGVGLIAVQWAKHLGVRIIGTTSSPEKAALAKSLGCDEVINYSEENVAERVHELTDGKGVPVVYDGIGQATLNASLNSLSPLGLLASFGSASGPVKNFDTGILGEKGSLYLTRPSLKTYVASDEALQTNISDLFAVVGSGAVKIEVNQTYALADAANAHRDLEDRKTTGSTVLLP